MVSKSSNVPRLTPRTQRASKAAKEQEAAAEAARDEAEAAAEAARAALSQGDDLLEYMKHVDKEKITFNLTSDICESIRDHARPLRMSYSEIVERGVRMFFRSEMIDVPGPADP